MGVGGVLIDVIVVNEVVVFNLNGVGMFCGVVIFDVVGQMIGGFGDNGFNLLDLWIDVFDLVVGFVGNIWIVDIYYD